LPQPPVLHGLTLLYSVSSEDPHPVRERKKMAAFPPGARYTLQAVTLHLQTGKGEPRAARENPLLIYPYLADIYELLGCYRFAGTTIPGYTRAVGIFYLCQREVGRL